MIIEYLLVAILSALILYIMCNRKKKYESFETDDGEYGPQFVYSTGRIKTTEGGLDEGEIDDYNSAAAIKRRRLKQLEEEAKLYELELARQQFERPDLQVPSAPSAPQARPPLDIRPPMFFPSAGGMPPIYRPSTIPTVPTPPPYGQIKEEEETGKNLLAQIGKVVKKKRKIG